eukprot:8667203-Heterocapsa_arctica.AAC.1
MPMLKLPVIVLWAMVEGALAGPLRDIQEIILLDVAPINSNASDGRGQSPPRQLSVPANGPPLTSSPRYAVYELKMKALAGASSGSFISDGGMHQL